MNTQVNIERHLDTSLVKLNVASNYIQLLVKGPKKKKRNILL